MNKCTEFPKEFATLNQNTTRLSCSCDYKDHCAETLETFTNFIDEELLNNTVKGFNYYSCLLDDFKNGTFNPNANSTWTYPGVNLTELAEPDVGGNVKEESSELKNPLLNRTSKKPADKFDQSHEKNRYFTDKGRRFLLRWLKIFGGILVLITVALCVSAYLAFIRYSTPPSVSRLSSN